MKALEIEPYTIEESERAAGMGSYVNPRKRKIETYVPDAVKSGETIGDIKKRAKILSDGDSDMKWIFSSAVTYLIYIVWPLVICEHM